MKRIFLAAVLVASQASATVNPPSASPLFSSAEIVNLELRADIKKIMKVAKKDSEGMNKPDRDEPKYFTSGTLVDLASPDRQIKMQVRARGMSSLWDGEAEFPKLRVEIEDAENLKGTLFKGSKNFRINTHVATDPKKKWTEMSRLNSELSPFREALAYDEARIIGLETPAFRRARIHYFDLGTKKDFTRNALLIETDKKVGERTGTTKLEDAEFLDREGSGVDPDYGAKYFLFHALIGNADTGLRVNETSALPTEFYRPIFNTTVFERPDGTRFAIAYDLDMALQVSGYDGISFTVPEFGLDDPESAMMALDLTRLRIRFTKAQIGRAVAEFKAKAQELEKTIKTATVDEEGRTIALRRLSKLFKVLDLVSSFKVIGTEGVKFYADAKKSKEKIKLNPITDESGTLRLGEPVIVLGQEGNMLKVATLNHRGDVEDGESIVGYIEATTPIVSSLPDSEIGKVDMRDFAQP